MVALFLNCFQKGDQLKVKLANLKFSEIGDGPLFLVFGGRLVIGGRDYYIYIYISYYIIYIYIFRYYIYIIIYIYVCVREYVLSFLASELTHTLHLRKKPKASKASKAHHLWSPFADVSWQIFGKKTLIPNIIPNIIPLSAVQLVAISLFIELSEYIRITYQSVWLQCHSPEKRLHHGGLHHLRQRPSFGRFPGDCPGANNLSPIIPELEVLEVLEVLHVLLDVPSGYLT